MPFNTRNPIPSGDLRDLDDNARNIDTWANDKTKLSHPDRFGVERRTWHGIEQEAQLNIQQAIDAKNAAQYAAMMSGFSKYADTLAQLEGGIGTDYIEGDVVMVFQDESRGDTSSIYKVESGVAVFKNAFDKTRQDLLSFTGNISADAQWSDVPAHSDPAFDVQAQALANRTEFIAKGLTEPNGNEPVGGFDSYEKLRAYSGNATRSTVGVLGGKRRGIWGPIHRTGESGTAVDDNGVWQWVDADGMIWRRSDFDGTVHTDWAGTVADGIADDYAAIQRAINSVSATTFDECWDSGVPVYRKGGGRVCLDPGRYRHTQPILIGAHTEFFGQTKAGFFIPADKAQDWSSVLIPDFANPLQFALETANYDNAGNRKAYNAGHSKSSFDDGLFNHTHSVIIHGIAVIPTNNCYGAVRMNCCPDSKIYNVWLTGNIDVQCVVNVAWDIYVDIRGTSKYYGIALINDINGATVKGYSSGNTNSHGVVPVERRLMTVGNVTVGTGLPAITVEKSMGLCLIYAKSVDVSGLVTENFQLAGMFFRAIAALHAWYTEGNSWRLIQSVSSTLHISALESVNPSITTEPHCFFGFNSKVVFEATSALRLGQASESINSITVVDAFPERLGWKYYRFVNYLGVSDGYVRASVSGSDDNIAIDDVTHTPTFVTIAEAFRRINASKQRDWVIGLKAGDTFDLSFALTIKDKNITFVKVGTGGNPTLRVLSRQPYVHGDVSISLQDVDISIPEAMPAYEQGFIKVLNSSSSNVDFTMTRGTVNLGSNGSLIQYGWESSQVIKCALRGVVFDGDGWLGSGAYQGATSAVVISTTRGCTIPSTVLARGTNGWAGEVIK